MKRLIVTELRSKLPIYSIIYSTIIVVFALILSACSSLPGSDWLESPKEAPKKQTTNRTTISSAQRPTHIAVILPERGAFASPASSVRAGILNAKQQDHAGNKVDIRFYDSESQPVASTYDQAIKAGADFVIGPLTKDNVAQLLRNTSITVPTLALNYTDARRPAKFYEIGLMPEDEIEQMLTEARKKGLSRALLIAPQSSFGTRLTKPLVSHWQAKGGQLVDTLYFTPQTNFSEAIPRLLHVDVANDKALMKNSDRNKSLLENQRRHDFDVIFLVTKPKEARTILPLLRYFYVNDTPIYAPSSVYAEPDPISDVDLNGVYVCDIPGSMLSDHAPTQPNHRLYALGQDAYLISQSLSQLQQSSSLSLPGETGELSLSNNNQIRREVSCGVMRNGYLSPT